MHRQGLSAGVAQTNQEMLLIISFQTRRSGYLPNSSVRFPFEKRAQHSVFGTELAR